MTVRRRRSALLALLAAVATALAVATSAAGAATVKVWFLQGEQMIAVDRPGSSGADAVRELLAGPTAAETRRGIRSYLLPGTPLRGVSVANGVAVVELGTRFADGGGADGLRARLAQVVYTATGPEGATKVRLLVDGAAPPAIFPGVAVARPITVASLERPDVPARRVRPVKPGPVLAAVRAAQQRLADLGYLLPGDVDGRFGPATQTAVLAFQKWEGLTRDGILGPQTRKRLETAERPTPATTAGRGKRIEVLLDRQLALAIEDDRVVRVVHASTGKPSTPTPPGSFKVYGKFPNWWSVPFREVLPWAVAFNGGIALHEFPEVPVYPASHGCVRQSFTSARWMFDFTSIGMPVRVVAHSQ